MAERPTTLMDEFKKGATMADDNDPSDSNIPGDGSREDNLRKAASKTDLTAAQPDLSKYMSLSDFRVDFTKRRRAVFMVTGYLGLLAGAITFTLLWCLIKNVEHGQPVDPTIGNIISGLITALFINVAAIIGSYLVVPAWESSNFRKNFSDVIKTVSDSNIQRTALRSQKEE